MTRLRFPLWHIDGCVSGPRRPSHRNPRRPSNRPPTRRRTSRWSTAPPSSSATDGPTPNCFRCRCSPAIAPHAGGPGRGPVRRRQRAAPRRAARWSISSRTRSCGCSAGRVRLSVPGRRAIIAYRIDAPSAWVQINTPGRVSRVPPARRRGRARGAARQRGARQRTGPQLHLGRRADLRPRRQRHRRPPTSSIRRRGMRSTAGRSRAAISGSACRRSTCLKTCGGMRRRSTTMAAGVTSRSYGYVWYPRVQVGWRPYYHGRWASLRPVRLDLDRRRSLGISHASLWPLGDFRRGVVLDSRAIVGAGLGLVGLRAGLRQLVSAWLEQSAGSRLLGERLRRTALRPVVRLVRAAVPSLQHSRYVHVSRYRSVRVDPRLHGLRRQLTADPPRLRRQSFGDSDSDRRPAVGLARRRIPCDRRSGGPRVAAGTAGDAMVIDLPAAARAPGSPVNNVGRPRRAPAIRNREDGRAAVTRGDPRRSAYSERPAGDAPIRRAPGPRADVTPGVSDGSARGFRRGEATSRGPSPRRRPGPSAPCRACAAPNRAAGRTFSCALIRGASRAPAAAATPAYQPGYSAPEAAYRAPQNRAIMRGSDERSAAREPGPRGGVERSGGSYEPRSFGGGAERQPPAPAPRTLRRRKRQAPSAAPRAAPPTPRGDGDGGPRGGSGRARSGRAGAPGRR